MRKLLIFTCLWALYPLSCPAQEEPIGIDSVEYYRGLLLQASDDRTKGLVHLDFGKFYCLMFDYDSAEVHFIKAIQYFEQEDDPFHIGKAFYRRASGYTDRDMVAKALEFQFESLKNFEIANDTAWMANALNVIGNSFNYLEENDKALTYYDRAEEYYAVVGDHIGQAMIYHNKAIILSESGQYEEAIDNYEKGAELFATYSDESDLILTYSNMAMDYEQLYQYGKAREYHTMALDLAIKYKQPANVAYVNLNLGRLLSSIGKYDTALVHLNQALSMAEKQQNAQIKANSVWQLAQTHSKLGNYKEAFQYLLIDNEMDSLIYNEQNANIIHEMETKYRVDMVDRENEILKQQDLINQADLREQQFINLLVFIGLGGVGIISIVLLFGYRKIKKQKDQIEHQADKLQQLDHYKSRFFANISHDIRTPLTLISGYAHQVKTDKANYLTDKSRQDLARLERNSQKLSDMADEIGDLILLEEGSLKLRYSRVKIHSYLSLLVNMFSSAAEIRKTELRYLSKLKDDLVVHLDRKKFEQIIYNVISNAFKYTHAGSLISVELAQPRSGWIEIVIADDGVGIDEKHLPSIFDRYFQAPDGDYKEKEGFGIGLALVKELVNLHGGTISAHSQLGEGTSFIISLPDNLEKALEEESLPEATIERKSTSDIAEADEAVSTNGTHKDAPYVLVVDDHPEVREYISGIVQEKFNVIEGKNGKHALEVLHTTKVNAIITDLMMPWLDGFGLIEEIKNDPRLNSIPVMVVSARTTEEDKLKVLNSGVNDFMSKPFDPEKLIKRVENLIVGNSTQSNPWNDLITEKDEFEKGIIEKINQEIIRKINDPTLSVKDLANEICASERKTYRLIKELTGHTPLDYIKHIRFDYVNNLLKNETVKNASEAARAIGMSNVTQFSRQYKKIYGDSPE